VNASSTAGVKVRRRYSPASPASGKAVSDSANSAARACNASAGRSSAEAHRERVAPGEGPVGEHVDHLVRQRGRGTPRAHPSLDHS